MERASRLIAKLTASADTVQFESLVRAAWPAAVGKKVHNHTRVIKMVRSTLVVEVEDWVWQRQLFALRGQVVANLRRMLGTDAVEEIEFRVMPQRRGPQVAQQSSADEAETITDPVMRSIYKASRRKALA